MTSHPSRSRSRPCAASSTRRGRARPARGFAPRPRPHSRLARVDEVELVLCVVVVVEALVARRIHDRVDAERRHAERLADLAEAVALAELVERPECVCHRSVLSEEVVGGAAQPFFEVRPAARSRAGSSPRSTSAHEFAQVAGAGRLDSCARPASRAGGRSSSASSFTRRRSSAGRDVEDLARSLRPRPRRAGSPRRRCRRR